MFPNPETSFARRSCSFISPSLWEGRPASGRGGVRAGSDARPSPRFARPSQGEGDERMATQRFKTTRPPYANVRAEHGKRRALPEQTASLWAWHDRAGCLRNRKGLPHSLELDWGCPGDASAPDEGFHIP